MRVRPHRHSEIDAATGLDRAFTSLEPLAGERRPTGIVTAVDVVTGRLESTRHLGPREAV
jgi:hypothetical protein